MVTLKLLGRISLSDSSGPVTGQITQRRRLAFLAILGASPRATVTRDRLVALLWPDLDAEGARHRLSDSLYVVRRALGDAAIVTDGDDLRLSEEFVAVDTRAFERALEAGDAALAITQYGGPLLDGFHLGGEGEFDRWMEQERGRLAGRYAQALRTIAVAADQRGDHVAAGEYLQRLFALDPLDSRVVLQLMNVLERAGNGAVALRHARMHQTLRQSELGLGEDPSVRAAHNALVARLDRATANSVASEPVTEVHAIAPSVATTEPKTEPKTEPEAGANTESFPESVRVSLAFQRSGARRARVLIGAGAIVASALALAVVRNRTAFGSVGSPAASRAISATASVAPAVAVFPFLLRGGDSSAFTGDALAALIATKLDGGAGLRTIDPNAIRARYRPGKELPDPLDAARLARSLDAGYFVLGEQMQTSGRLYLGAVMYDATDGKPVDARIGVQGASAGVFELVDSLASRLLVARQIQPAPNLERLASLTTSSLPALKLFMEGESFSRAGQYEAAAERYERATIADSAFALGYYRLAWANNWIPGRGLDQSLLERTARHATRLPEPIRLTVAALQAVARGDFQRGVMMLADVTEQYPDDFDATLWLGDVLFRQNAPHGRPPREARGALERASVLAPARSADALYHLIELATRDGRLRDVDSLSTLFLTLDHDSDRAPIVRTILAVVHPEPARLAAARRELEGMSTNTALHIIAVVTSEIGRAHHSAVANLLASLATPSADNMRGAVFFRRAQLAGTDGDWRVADSLLDLAAAARFEDATFVRGRFLSFSSLDPPPAMIRGAIADLHALAISTPVDRHWADLFAAMLALKLGDTMPATVVLPRAARIARTDPWIRELTFELSARQLLATGKPDEALALLLSYPPDAAPDPPLRFVRGQVLEALHRPTEALAWYDASGQDWDAESYAAAIARAHTRLDRR